MDFAEEVREIVPEIEPLVLLRVKEVGVATVGPVLVIGLVVLLEVVVGVVVDGVTVDDPLEEILPDVLLNAVFDVNEEVEIFANVY